MPSHDIPSTLLDDLSRVGLNVADLVLYINSQCNLRCGHCYVGNALLNASHYYSYASLNNLFQNLPPLKRMTILGGEPLLHPDILLVLQSARTPQCAERRLTTNLTFLNTAISTFLQHSDFFIAVSLDGLEVEHEQLRGSGTFQGTVRNLVHLQQLGCRFEITHTITSDNIDRFDDFVEFARGQGFEQINLHCVTAQGNAAENKRLVVSATKWRSFVDQLLAKTAPSGRRAVRIRVPLRYATHSEYSELIASGQYHDHAHGSFYAGRGEHRIVIFPNRRVYISSEAFGSDSYIGEFSSGRFIPNTTGLSEVALAQAGTFSVSQMNPEVAGDTSFPVALSVSYKLSASV